MVGWLPQRTGGSRLWRELVTPVPCAIPQDLGWLLSVHSRTKRSIYADSTAQHYSHVQLRVMKHLTQGLHPTRNIKRRRAEVGLVSVWENFDNLSEHLMAYHHLDLWWHQSHRWFRNKTNHRKAWMQISRKEHKLYQISNIANVLW